MANFTIEVSKGEGDRSGCAAGDICFYVNGEFHASWGPKSKGPTECGSVLRQMFQMAYDQGAADRGAKIKKLLG